MVIECKSQCENAKFSLLRFMIITHDNNEDNGSCGGLDNIDYDNDHYGDQNNNDDGTQCL